MKQRKWEPTPNNPYLSDVDYWLEPWHIIVALLAPVVLTIIGVIIDKWPI